MIDHESLRLEAMSKDSLLQHVSAIRDSASGRATQDGHLIAVFAAVREVARRCIGLRPYTVQLEAGIALYEGRITECATGEGKTLTATLPAAMHAISGGRVHVITVNDYLARRDYEWMGPVYETLGLRVGLIVSDMSTEERSRSYDCDIVYGTNKQFGFDYLRDQLLRLAQPPRLGERVRWAFEGRKPTGVQRGHDFAIIDEADSVLIDEARVPLIISESPSVSPDAELYLLADRVASQLSEGEDYWTDSRDMSIVLTREGQLRAYELLPNGRGPHGSERPWSSFVEQSLRAKCFFHRDKQYLVEEDRLVIVDEFTGRKMRDRHWSDGLHQAIEAAEGLQIRGETRTLAQITLQRYFRGYRKLAGMTGTAKTSASEFRATYSMPVVRIPTHRPVQREMLPDRVFRTREAKFAAIANEVRRAQGKGRPTLIGTRSVGISELLSDALRRAEITHEVLNARQDAREAEKIGGAGQAGSVMIATNMAGRGTDIILGDGVAARGGLLVIGTERHEARRVDLQLAGRAGRQGDPGTAVFFLSPEDELFQRHSSKREQSAIRSLESDSAGELPSAAVKYFDAVQQRVERFHRRVRTQLEEHDRWMETMLRQVAGGAKD